MPEMNGDRERLEQVVINILSNAVKYTPRGGHITLRGLRKDENDLMIQVKDDGMGIPKEDIPRLFERFYRVDKARSRAKGGSGLGLAIAKEMVEAHNGTIYLDSTMDEGTTVTIMLPTTLPADDEEMMKIQKSKRELKNLAKNLALLFLTLLLVLLTALGWVHDLSLTDIPTESWLGRWYINLNYGEAGGFELRSEV